MAAAAYFETVQKIYIAFYQRPADPAGLEYWAKRIDAASGDAAAVVSAFATSPEAVALYGPIDATTIGTVIDKIYLALFNKAPDAAGKQFYVDGFTSGKFTAGTIALNILNGAANDDAVAIANKLQVANEFTKQVDGRALDDAYFGTGSSFNATYSGDADAQAARDILKTVTSSPATVLSKSQVTEQIQNKIADAGDPIKGETAGKTFTLTSGMDTLVGTANNDTFKGKPGDLGALDSIDGGAGVDTMALVRESGTDNFSAAATVKNVENLSILSASGAVSAVVSTWTGLETVAIDSRDSTADSTVTTNANVTSVSVKGGKSAVITDTATTGDKLTTVTLDGLASAATVSSDALTSLTLNNLNTAVTATVTGAHALNLTLNNVGATGTVATVTDATATSVTVNATGKASAAVSLAASSATALTINADETVGISSLDTAAAKTITVKGDSLVTITAATVTALESVSTVDSTGGVTITPALGTTVSFTGGAGKDTITLGATTKAITTGAGDDNVTVGSSFGTGGSVDAGLGEDTLTMTAANAIAASSGTVFETKIAGFEKLSLGTIGASGAVDLANLDDISYVVSAGGSAALTLNNLAANGTLELTAGNSGGTTLNIVNQAANTATNDVLNLKLVSSASVAAGTVTAAKFEIIKITTDDTTTGTASFNDTLTLVTVDATDISVTGDAGLTLTFTGTKLTTFDASGVTKGDVSFTTGALENAATIKGGAGANTFDITAATKAVSITGGNKVDTITIGTAAGVSGTAATVSANNNDNTVVTLDGNDVVTIVGGGKNTVDLGAGNDVLNLGISGTVTADVTTGLNVVTLGAGADTINVNVAATNGNTYTTLTGFGTDDKIDFSGLLKHVNSGNATIANKTDIGAAITLGDTAAFADFVQAASTKAVALDAPAVSWFQYQGNTYVAVDTDTAVTFQNGKDTIIKLTGLIDLSTADLASNALVFSGAVA